MNHVLFAGCSYTAGSGWELEHKDPNLWVNLLHQNTQLKKYNLLNPSIGGRSNAGIFSDAVYNLTHFDCEYAFVAWTSSPRYEMELGLEMYDTRHIIIPNAPSRQHNLNDCTYVPAYLNKIRDRVVSLVHPHYEILNLVCYVNSLIAIASLKNTKLFFINAICPWDQQYFTTLHNVLPSEYTAFTQEIINVVNRSDVECEQLYNKIHNQYYEMGGIQEKYWINLYDSLITQQIDVNSDGLHPGKKSNQLYYEKISQALI
jgi:hypothetical protein